MARLPAPTIEAQMNRVAGRLEESVRGITVNTLSGFSPLVIREMTRAVARGQFRSLNAIAVSNAKILVLAYSEPSVALLRKMPANIRPKFLGDVGDGIPHGIGAPDA